MGRHILFALLSGFLMLGMSNAFAEESQPSDQEILKAWGSAQIEANQILEAPAHMVKPGLQVLTDEKLDKVTAAGSTTFGLLTNQGCGVGCFQKTWNIGRNQITKCVGLIASCTAFGR